VLIFLPLTGKGNYPYPSLQLEFQSLCQILVRCNVLNELCRWTPILYSSCSGNAACIRYLLDTGQLVNVTNPEGRSPLHLAAQMGDATVTQSLLSHAISIALSVHFFVSDFNEITPPKLLENNSKVKEKFSVVLVLSFTSVHDILQYIDYCQCIKLLLDRGANVNTSDAYGSTPVASAAFNNYSECVDILIRHNAGNYP
jgi:ankyrin repeat protein